ncbi:MAG: glycoside hydrolase family 16 protein [Mucinivorans sp.]
MKKITFMLFLGLMAACSVAQNVDKKEYRLIWSDDFDGSQFDASKWSRIPRGLSHWDRYMSPRADLVEVADGKVAMHGILNPDRSTDTVRYLTGGLYSKDKFAFLYGKIEIRARLASLKGAWPAFWLLPNKTDRVWPNDGEIDIMEHLNFDDFVYQTVHSYYTVKLGIKNNPKHGGTGKIDREQYNIYGVEWTPDEIIFSINGVSTFSYPKIKTDKKGQWPFTVPFYILIDQQLGGPKTWVGEVDESKLPVSMWIDYVRVYQKQ